MAVPKKRTGHSAQGHRRSNWKATKPETTKCPNCGETVLTHTVCTACGTYKGQPVSLKDRVEEVAEVKKPAKKSSKKAEKVEEVKADCEQSAKADAQAAAEDTSNASNQAAEETTEVKEEVVETEE